MVEKYNDFINEKHEYSFPELRLLIEYIYNQLQEITDDVVVNAHPYGREGDKTKITLTVFDIVQTPFDDFYLKINNIKEYLGKYNLEEITVDVKKNDIIIEYFINKNIKIEFEQTKEFKDYKLNQDLDKFNI